MLQRNGDPHAEYDTQAQKTKELNRTFQAAVQKVCSPANEPADPDLHATQLDKLANRVDGWFDEHFLVLVTGDR